MTGLFLDNFSEIREEIRAFDLTTGVEIDIDELDGCDLPLTEVRTNELVFTAGDFYIIVPRRFIGTHLVLH